MYFLKNKKQARKCVRFNIYYYFYLFPFKFEHLNSVPALYCCINWSHNLTEVQEYYCALWLQHLKSYYETRKKTKLQSKDTNSKSLDSHFSLVNDAAACYWLQSLEVSRPRLWSLWGACGNTSTDEQDWSSDDDVTLYESNLIYMLNNDKLICKFFFNRTVANIKL